MPSTLDKTFDAVIQKSQKKEVGRTLSGPMQRLSLEQGALSK
ncbi:MULTISPECIES: hypothetical protein [Brucella]|uniref:Uncharacterized protein n=1 Tax=Brucella lupini TaxID=255457 RepID=A0A256GLR4_9HYPH|nr:MULTISPECIES: hypothetical protein [Brucella]MDG9792332.1 hypothetical protein [Brucella anthropi]MDH0582204.1 hypothetical protein [Brucella anthropi]MDH0819256.1 hypothetical protein [Brucella anthropi]MDH2085760.1 hypothetical protein [Brucella anthropi]OYR28019.1 hypothetical protein CES86_3017 [Brucella lupini]